MTYAHLAHAVHVHSVDLAVWAAALALCSIALARIAHYLWR